MAGFDLLLLAVLSDGRAQLSDVDIGVIALVSAFALVEWRVIHVQFRAEASSFSLFEIPLVLGLLYTTPGRLVVATVGGVALGLLAGRRQPPLKIVFNAVNLGMYAGIAAALVAQSPLPDDERMIWLSILAAVVVGSAASFGLIILAVTLTEGFPGARRSIELLSFGLIVSVTNATIGLTAGIVLARDVVALLLLALPAFLLFTAFRMITSEREQRERVEFLYRSTRRLDVGASEAGLMTLLHEAREMFRAELGAVVLWEEDHVRVVRSAGPEEKTTSSAQAEVVDLVASALRDLGEPAMVSRDDVGPLAELVATVGGRDAMLAKLRAEDRDLGFVVVADRLGEVTSFTANDLQVLGALARQSAILMHSDRLEQALTELRQLEHELAYQASHDSLTGLPNRSALTEALHLAAGSGRRHALLFIDLDGFKKVNDSHGHAAGDAVLVEVADRLKRIVRPGDTVSRFGGDEFAMLLVDAVQPTVVADRIVAALAEPIGFPEGHATIGCSIGVVVGDDDQDPESLLREADAAMYRAKQSGKGTVVEHQGGASTGPTARTGALETAVGEEQLELHYQPIVDLSVRRIAGVEALVRWRHPERGLLLPGEFLGEAERTGVIGQIDRWVLTRAAGELADVWAIDPDLFVSVNLAPRHLIDESIAWMLALPALDAARGRLMIEWPEEVLVDESDRFGTALAAIREAGAVVALDRFGDGHASLGYLQRLDIDAVKLGRRLGERLTGPNGNAGLVRGVVDIAHALGMRVIADGIEGPDQLAALEGTGCDQAQGFLFARPMSVDDLRLVVGQAVAPTTRPAAPTNRLT
jgi:diguanylate cyclase (GGDEF)-like protein